MDLTCWDMNPPPMNQNVLIAILAQGGGSPKFLSPFPLLMLQQRVVGEEEDKAARLVQCSRARSSFGRPCRTFGVVHHPPLQLPAVGSHRSVHHVAERLGGSWT